MRRAAIASWVLWLCGCGSESPSQAAQATDAAGDGGAEVEVAVDAAPPPPVVELVGDDAADTSDLAPVAAMLGGADVIGIGEAIHTSAGFYRMRNRLIRHLVEHGNVRVIAFESMVARVETQMAPYVSRCEGTPENAARGLHNIWWDKSTPVFLKWLCEWNAAHPKDPVRVVGFDIRQPWTDVPALRAYMAKAAPADGALVDALKPCIGATYADEAAFFKDPTIQAYYDASTLSPEADHAACATATSALASYLRTKKDSLVAASDARSHRLAELAVVRVAAFDITVHGLSRLPEAWPTLNIARDKAMTEQLLGLRALDFPTARVAIWAHNGHVFSSSDKTIDGLLQWSGVKNLGTLLAEALPGRYAAVGQYAFVTNYEWFDTAEKLPKPKAGSIEQTLEALGKPFLAVDVAAATAEGSVFTPGQRYLANFEGNLVPTQSYGVILFQHESGLPDWFTPPMTK